MLYEIPSLVLIASLLLAMVATVETGIRIGKKHGRTTWAEAHQIHTVLTTATLALMGLLLAFTFNLSATRYELRKTLIVTESTAIQSVHSDIDFLSQPSRSRALHLLQAYLGKRIGFLTVGNNPDREEQAAEHSRAMHGALWAMAINPSNYVQTDPQIRAAQYSTFTRDLLDLNRVAREREQARTRRVPEAVIFMLLAFAIGSSAVMSYMSGAAGHPDRLPTYAVMALICLVIYLIIDFDRPRRGLMHVDPAPLQQLLPTFSG
jgi:hypothetical protein